MNLGRDWGEVSRESVVLLWFAAFALLPLPLPFCFAPNKQRPMAHQPIFAAAVNKAAVSRDYIINPRLGMYLKKEEKPL